MSIKPRKVAIVGAGHVGSHVGFSLATQGICDEIVFVDKDNEKAISQATDLADAVVYLPHRLEVNYGGFEDCKDADIMVISAGPLPVYGKETRMDTLAATMVEMKDIVQKIKAIDFQGIVISISNPADVITHYIQRSTGIPAHRVLSTSTTLDSARLRRVLSQHTGVDQKSIYAYAMGEHGESQMVPWSTVNIGGKPLSQLREEYPETYGKLDLQAIQTEAKGAGWVVLKGKGSTEFGIGTALSELAKAIFHNEHRVLPVSVYLNGEYGQKDVYASVPAVLGKDGIESIIELKMTDEELAQFAASCQLMKDNFELALKM